MVLSGCGLESEEDLRSNFAANREAIGQILKMQHEDSDVVRIAPEFTRLKDNWAWPREDVGFSEERWERYRKLFKEAGITDGIDSNDGNVFFYVSSQGLSVTGTSRGYAHVKDTPRSVVANFERCPRREGICYVKVEDNWYLFEWVTY